MFFFPPPESRVREDTDKTLRCQKIHQDRQQELHLQEPIEWEAQHHNYYQIIRIGKQKDGELFRQLCQAANLQDQLNSSL